MWRSTSPSAPPSGERHRARDRRSPSTSRPAGATDLGGPSPTPTCRPGLEDEDRDRAPPTTITTRHRGALAVATGRLYGFLKRHRLFDAAAVWVSRRVRESPPILAAQRRARPAPGPLPGRDESGRRPQGGRRARSRSACASGSRAGGGWTSWPDRPPAATTTSTSCSATTRATRPGRARRWPLSGYRPIEVLDGLWMTPRNLLDDGVGHQIEILGIDRERLDTALGLAGHDRRGTPIEDRAPHLFTLGTLDGRPVPCLSAELQLLFHSGFDPRGVDGATWRCSDPRPPGSGRGTQRRNGAHPRSERHEAVMSTATAPETPGRALGGRGLHCGRDVGVPGADIGIGGGRVGEPRRGPRRPVLATAP